MATGTAPSTPTLRNRPAAHGGSSPTSTTMSDSVSFHPAEEPPSLALLRGQTHGFPGSRKTIIRADPSLLTCFDVTDKQLYDLWAPKN